MSRNAAGLPAEFCNFPLTGDFKAASYQVYVQLQAQGALTSAGVLRGHCNTNAKQPFVLTTLLRGGEDVCPFYRWVKQSQNGATVLSSAILVL